MHVHGGGGCCTRSLHATKPAPLTTTSVTAERPHDAIAAVVLWVAVLVVLGAAAPASPSQPRIPARRILFIGNSLTTANDLPARIQALAGSVGDHLDCRAVAFPDFSLEDHWSQGDARRAISEGGWSIVVLQQGPSSLPESRVVLVDYTRRFATEARRIGARTALYMVWPSRDRLQYFDDVSASYAAAAHDVGGMLLPVGEAWRAAWRHDATLDLYGPDGFHPTLLATQLAALVIYQAVSGRPPIGLGATPTAPSPLWLHLGLSPAQGLLVEQAATEANARFGVR
jgi:hypothetical protein